MINILYTILLFSIIIILFKLFKKYKVDNLQALIVNYLTAAILSYFFLEQDFSIDSIIWSKWIAHSMIIGPLFIIVFSLYAFGIQKVGISVTTVANKMSLIIPVFAALILYPKKNTLDEVNLLALVLAFIGIYLSSTKDGKVTFEKKYFWIIILVFIGQGISDATFNDFAQRFPNQGGYLFFMILFIFAAITGVLLYTFSGKHIKLKNPLQLKSIFWGISLGIPNFYSLVFFLKALTNPKLASSIIFPLISMGIIISSSIIGTVIFKEKLSYSNWIGIILSISSIYIFSF
tara:strand:- start:8895 stop:9764 length:870 start_codon:yes stop_codon:yes gene_type:complete